MRLDKLLSNLKYGSRNDIKKLCKKGLITVNDSVVKDSGINVLPTDIIMIDGEEVFYKENITLMLNKPKGYICANKDGMHKTVLELIKEPYSRYDLNIAGRLDIDTEGLIILTTDGNLLHNIISPNKDVYKKYYVEYEGILEEGILENGIEILDGNNNPYLTKEAKVEYLNAGRINLWIKEGKFHQVKRMLEYCGCKVTYLKRLEIGEYKLDEKLGLGEYKIIE